MNEKDFTKELNKLEAEDFGEEVGFDEMTHIEKLEWLKHLMNFKKEEEKSN